VRPAAQQALTRPRPEMGGGPAVANGRVDSVWPRGHATTPEGEFGANVPMGVSGIRMSEETFEVLIRTPQRKGTDPWARGWRTSSMSWSL
jgi:hypothetical protein